jgi:hypothetical protein
MNNRTYVYEIVVAPDTTDDSVKPISLLNAFVKSASQKAMLSSFVPDYISTYASTTREIIPAKPRVRKDCDLLAVSHDTVTVQVHMWEQAYVYAVILLNPTARPLSSQVIHGLDASHYAVATTDPSGIAKLSFTLLNDNSSYTVFISAECVLPFKPRLALGDSEVLSVGLQTKVNLNLMKNEKDAVSVISQVNPALAEEVKKHMDKINAATEVEGSNKNQKRRSHK